MTSQEVAVHGKTAYALYVYRLREAAQEAQCLVYWRAVLANRKRDLLATIDGSFVLSLDEAADGWRVRRAVTMRLFGILPVYINAGIKGDDGRLELDVEPLAVVEAEKFCKPPEWRA